MYSIVLTNGEIINVKVTDVEWNERIIKLKRNGRIVAKIDVDNIVRWIYAG